MDNILSRKTITSCEYTYIIEGPLRKHAHDIYCVFLTAEKIDNFQLNFFFFLLFFHIFAQNIDCGYTLEPPQRGGSNEYPQSLF